jgi:hypothetical protein
MPPIKRAKALFFPNFHIREAPAMAILGAVRGLGSRPDLRHRFVIGLASLK